MKTLTHVRTGILIALVKVMVATALQHKEEGKETGNIRHNKKNTSLRRLQDVVNSADQYPWYTHSDQDVVYPCGGTLIHPDIVLTAAQCLPEVQNGLRIGELLFDGGDEVGIDGYKVHPNYNPISGASDIMVVKLSTASENTLVEYYRPEANPRPGDVLKVIGFGATSDVLQSVNMQIDDCSNNVDADTTIFSYSICAAVRNNVVRDTYCGGDRGGPLLDRRGRQIGINSGGERCVPGVFTRISAFAEWIKDSTCELSDNPPDSCAPSVAPSAAPTISSQPSLSFQPSAAPSSAPSKIASGFPSLLPTYFPTPIPTKRPTRFPTKSPTANPTVSQKPSPMPSFLPTDGPSVSFKPSVVPSLSLKPSSPPTKSPKPSQSPTISRNPVSDPTSSPTNKPTSKPTSMPTKNLSTLGQKIKFSLTKNLPDWIIPNGK